jgi:inner membrane protein
LHSAFAGLLISSLIGLILYLIDIKRKGLRNVNLLGSLTENRLLLIGFFLGFSLHMIEDMPTPASTWGGVNFLWPFNSYLGGTGDIWWWNNYDVFIIVVCAITINLILSFIRRVIDFDLRKFTIGVFILAFSFATIQVKTREYDFAYTGHTPKYQELENKSKQIQKKILGDRLYRLMERIDNRLRINF